ncbi:hypothetical protein ABZ135_32150 [Streptomyces sp. NPDC006339]|uniref:SCO2400 family protein n=1 Tax=Streptomyces sp. NPDC006339 TaxID=3156755 RepID=UPI00339EFA4C
MDYCSTCRRNLNGVFVCPGCGAYAPDIAPPAHLLHSAVASTTTTHEVWTAETDLPGADASGEAGGEGAALTGDALTGDALTGDGRAARRRQRARWKKHQRRALAATAVALVGGGLTIAAMPSTRPSTGHAHAAPPPEPVTTPPATSRTPVTAGSQERPDRPDTERPRTLPRTTDRSDHAGRPAAPAAASTTSRQPTAAPPPRTAPAPTAERDAGTAVDTAPAEQADAPTAPEPATPAPPAQGSAGTGTSLLGGLVSTTPATDPSSPAQVCLVGVCLG